MIRAWVDGIGVYAPGLVGWDSAAAILCGAAPCGSAPPPKLVPLLLPADVRRRTTEHIRLAVEVGSQAVAHALADAAQLWTVFASSESDGAITHSICEEVAKESPEVSPTRFHNSVNNAAAGYWCIAAQSRAPSTSVAGFDASFAVGLLEACAQVAAEHQAVLFVAHDAPFPEPLHSVRPMTAMFGTALVLATERSTRSLASLELSLGSAAGTESVLTDPMLEALRLGNPAARGLALLAALARGETCEVNLPYVSDQLLRVRVATV